MTNRKRSSVKSMSTILYIITKQKLSLRVNMSTPIKIYLIKIENITNYSTLHNALMRETIEINLEKENLCNDMTHSIVDNRWRKVLEER